jgi:hypothetical protein
VSRIPSLLRFLVSSKSYTYNYKFINRISLPGAKEVGSGESASIRNLLDTVMLTATSSALPEPEPISPVLIKRKRKNHVLSGNETQETSSLSNAELQRLVMLEQLKTLRTQRRFYQIQIENLDP